MICPECKKKIPDGSRFCGFCGREIPKAPVCVRCGAELKPGVRFCGHCGAPAEQTPPGDGGAAEQQLRQRQQQIEDLRQELQVQTAALETSRQALDAERNEVAAAREELRRTADALEAARREREEEARRAEEARKAEEVRLAEEKRKAEEARLAEERRKEEEARLAEEARKAEEARLAEEAAKAAEKETPAPKAAVPPEKPTEKAAVIEKPKKKKKTGWLIAAAVLVAVAAVAVCLIRWPQSSKGVEWPQKLSLTRGSESGNFGARITGAEYWVEDGSVVIRVTCELREAGTVYGSAVSPLNNGMTLVPFTVSESEPAAVFQIPADSFLALEELALDLHNQEYTEYRCYVVVLEQAQAKIRLSLEQPAEEDEAPTLDSVVQPGDTITFGCYEQDNDLTNGAEPIRWRVLEVKDGTALLISRQVLDYIPYDASGSARWDTSSLRATLNGAFYDSAFSAEEKAVMAAAQITPYDDPVTGVADKSDVTEDKVFILSLKQANDYFRDGLDRVTSATAYASAQAQAQAAAKDETLAEDFGISSKPGADWLLRTPGENEGVAVISRDTWYADLDRVSLSGFCFRDGDVADYRMGVRPCIRVRVPAADTTDTAGDLSSASVGDIITLGSYEQDNDASNGKEPIEWRVLDKTDGKLLVTSDRVLDMAYFGYEYEQATPLNWATSCVRGWLDHYFLQTAFTPAEQGRIVLSNIHTEPSPNIDTDPGPDAESYVFLLSAQEIEKYFPTNESRRALLTDSVHPREIERIRRTGGGTDAERINGHPMLRSPSEGVGRSAYVRNLQTFYWTAGDIWYAAIDTALEGDIRPAMWITVTGK